MTIRLKTPTRVSVVGEDQQASKQFLAMLRATTRDLSRATLLVLLIVSSARGACLHWDKYVDRPDESATYDGSLGEQRIRMMLHLDMATGHFEGDYGYGDQPGVRTLSGYMLPAGAGVDLEERNEHGQVSGHLSLAFFEPHVAPQVDWGDDWGFYQKHIRNSPSKCFYLTGVWQPEPWEGKPGQLITLHEAGPDIDPAENKARLKNEATAYQFRQALLHDDRKRVVSLFHYPFHSFDNSRNGQVTKTWMTPKSVLHNYDQIIKLTKYQRSAVPHILFTSAGVTDFMNRSVYLYEGKITWICAGACPTMPLNAVIGNFAGKY